MPLHPQVQAMREQRKRERIPQLYTLPLTEARALDLASIQAAAGEVEPVAEVVNRYLIGPGGRLPVRLYRPVLRRPRQGRSLNGRPLPVLVYFFGGGWILGTIDTADAVCRSLANLAQCLVVAVGYRLAPEHKFPAAVDDCYAATRWVARRARDLGADAGRIAVGGDSAGGNLAAVVAQLCRDGASVPGRAAVPAAGRGAVRTPGRGAVPTPGRVGGVGSLTLAGQLLVYPNTDYGATISAQPRNADPYMFNRTSVAWYWGHYLSSPADGLDPRASPLRAADLSRLPPALVITAEFDPLRDQAEQYARAMRHAGVSVTLTRYPGMVHGFFCMAGELDAGREAHAEAAAHLRTWFSEYLTPTL